MTRLAEVAGEPALVNELASGYGKFEEARMVNALWRVSRGLLSVEEFFSRYGFHGPQEGEICATSWREDPTQVNAIARKYADRGIGPGRQVIPCIVNTTGAVSRPTTGMRVQLHASSGTVTVLELAQ